VSVTVDRVELSDDEASLLRQASRLMSGALDHPRAHHIALIEKSPSGKEVARLDVPPQTMRLIAQLLGLMARQQTFTLCPESSELTTKQAAEVLGVSRPYLIGLLDRGLIPHRKVGRHRRIFSKDVVAYKATMQVSRKEALDELVKASEDVGGYEL
jgi:excisionase family DNA binding protein